VPAEVVGQCCQDRAGLSHYAWTYAGLPSIKPHGELPGPVLNLERTGWKD
jgi:hypothetical protein